MKHCCKCDAEHDRSHLYCKPCQAAYQRDWRRKKAMTPIQKGKASARAMARVYQTRGHLTAQPCEKCGATESVEMHHVDYASALDVRWLCTPCHRAEHGGALRISAKLWQETYDRISKACAA